LEADLKMKKRIIYLTARDIVPDRMEVFKSQGMKPGIQPSPMVQKVYDEAEKLFFELAEPVGLISGITLEEFAGIYKGLGKNEVDTPLEKIFPRAGNLAIFAFTLGDEISQRIDQLLKGGDFTLGYMLDTVASFCADKASGVAEQYFLDFLHEQGRTSEKTRVLLYSPGYCGWNISGQTKIFDYLQPGEIGMTLNGSYMMIPMKSISGVLVAGDKPIHFFKNNYPFCKDCHTMTCRQRIASL